MLYVVATPIGNLKDITLRAIETLKSVDLIAAEDTRHTKKLLSHYNIHKPLTSYFEHNKIKKADYIIAQIKEGKHVALVSDAGTPGISDPGFVIINKAIKEGIEVDIMPGTCALIAGLVLSGLPTDRFVFEGFLSHKSAARKKRLKELKEYNHTIVLYESPHRLIKALGDIKEAFEDTQVVCIREITKKFQEVQRGTAAGLIEHFSGNRPRGEFIILLDKPAKF